MNNTVGHLTIVLYKMKVLTFVIFINLVASNFES